jgi:hypothetical protein
MGLRKMPSMDNDLHTGALRRFYDERRRVIERLVKYGHITRKYTLKAYYYGVGS